MNKERKSKIKLYKSMIGDILNKLNGLLDEEQDYYDNIPENLQSSLKADISQDAIEELEEAISNLNDAIDHLDNI